MTTPAAAGGHLALQDLKRVVSGALATNGALLTAGERVVCHQILELDGAAGRIYARLSGRSGHLFRVDQLRYDDAEAGIDALVRVGLVHGGIPWSQRLPCFTVVELKDACRRLELRVSGKRQQLEERLRDRTGWHEARIVRLSNKTLHRRLELLWFRSPWRDRSVLVLERLGQVAPAVYPISSGGRAFRTRSDLLEYEAVRRGEFEPEAALARAALLAPRPAHLRRLDAREVLVDGALERARELERAKEDERAEAVYRGALELGVQPHFAAWRLAQILGRTGRAGEGSRVCESWRERVRPASALQLERTGRRLAKKARSHWLPATPLKVAPERRVRLPRAEDVGNRPGWGRGVLVEQACIEALGERRALFAENLLWTTVFGLLFVDLYFLPVDGMLPAPFQSGPLDLGTPDFRGRRPQVEERLDALRSGRAVDVLERSWKERQGQSIAGLAWKAWAKEDLVHAVEGIGAAVAAICERLLDEGWSAARGLPDLCVLPGAACVIDAIPAKIPSGLSLVEVKGPSDAMRDEQRVWHDVLLRAGVRVEVWHIAP